MKRGLKALTATLMAALLLVSAAAPASAATENFDITDGVLSTAIGSFEFGDGAAVGPCGPTTGSGTIGIEPTGSGNYSTAITSLNIDGSLSLGSPAAAYLVEFRLDGAGNNSGTITAGGAVTQNLRLFMRVFTTTGTPPECQKDVEACRVRITFYAPSSTALAGTASVVPPAAPGDTISLSGSSSPVTNVLGGPGCNPPAAILTGSTATIPASDPLVLTIL